MKALGKCAGISPSGSRRRHLAARREHAAVGRIDLHGRRAASGFRAIGSAADGARPSRTTRPSRCRPRCRAPRPNRRGCQMPSACAAGCGAGTWTWIWAGLWVCGCAALRHPFAPSSRGDGGGRSSAAPSRAAAALGRRACAGATVRSSGVNRTSSATPSRTCRGVSPTRAPVECRSSPWRRCKAPQG